MIDPFREEDKERVSDCLPSRNEEVIPSLPRNGQSGRLFRHKRKKHDTISCGEKCCKCRRL
jgi:hypothetical protein